MSTKKPKFIIIDGNALMHRGWHALPPTMSTKDGQIVNAVYGFTMTLLKVLKDLKPEFLAVTFDLAAPTFRHKEYKEYKANRVKQADELYEQFPIVKKVVKAFNIPIYEQEGFEADDIIATLVKDKAVEKIHSIIVTGDLDTLQLVDENTEVYTMRKGISDSFIYNIVEVKRRFDGLTPEQMVDYKALRGDPSDNIPGVKGIGEKGAITLLKEFKTLENLYENIDSKKIKDRHRDLLKEHKEEALMSKGLAQMVDDLPINFNLEDTKVESYDLDKIIPLFQELEFKSLMNKLPDSARRSEAKAAGQLRLQIRKRDVDVAPSGVDASSGADAPSGVDAPSGAGTPSGAAGYKLIKTEADFKKFITELKKQRIFALDTETGGLNSFVDELLGISFCWKKAEAYYLPIKKSWLELIKPILENPEIKKIGHNIKFDLESIGSAGINLQGISFDTMIASYLINPGSRQHNLDGLVFSELGYQMQPIVDLIGKGKDKITLKEVPIQKVSDYSCEDADFTWRLVKPLTKQLEDVNNLGLLEKIEVPLIPVLAEIEKNGVMIDVKFLQKMGQKVGKDLLELEKKIYRLAGSKFNIASPLQLKAVLFEDLLIPTQGLAKTKTGISTAASELEKIRGSHKIVDQIIKFRELAKLKSTYLDALPKLTDKSSRIHTSFNQTVTATGRLSSSEPNLQNIPIRTELGKKIREAFIAPKGYKILSADYSQIELRIIASLAKDKKMIAGFEKNEDIHTRTAAEINNVALDKVTKQMRYAAKAVNFGIIYGQGPHGLAINAGIDYAQARDFIDRYFLAHKEIKNYLEKTKKLAAKKGFVETFFGRRRYLPEINSNIQPIRATAERMAINHPIQGTAADLMKLAMIEIHKGLKKISAEAKMLLQVHDELVFEVPEKDVKKVAKFVEDKMEEIYKLRTSVQTNIEIGKNWGKLEKIK